MTTGGAFFSGAAATVGASVSPGNGVTPFGTIFKPFVLSAFDEPNIRCHKLGFGAGSGTGISTTGSAPGAVTIFGADSTCTTCVGVTDVGCAGVAMTATGFGADAFRGD